MKQGEWILVAYASKHGATREIARKIRRGLKRAGFDVDMREIGEIDSLDGYGAIVLGSAVYMGHWLKPARAFVAQHADELRQRDCWLFSSGPVGDSPQAAAEKNLAIDDVLEATHAREHHIFSGALDSRSLSACERFVVHRLRAGDGDYRDWAEIDKWAAAIAGELSNARQPMAR